MSFENPAPDTGAVQIDLVETTMPNETEQKDSQQLVINLNRIFGEKFGLSVPESELPEVILSENGEASFIERDEEGNPFNKIELNKTEGIKYGDELGEEMGHFYRSHFRPDHQEYLTDEFFGFLGSRLFHKATTKEDGTSDYFKRKPDVRLSFMRTKGMIVDELKNKKGELRDLAAKIEQTTDEKTRQDLLDRGESVYRDREEITRHYRGYEYAEKVDLERIQHWTKVFSLSDKDVRNRFFTPTPDYSDL